MEPGAEIKFARVYTARSLNLVCAGAFAKMKFHAARAVLAKTQPLKPAAIIYAAQTASRTGADPQQN